MKSTTPALRPVDNQTTSTADERAQPRSTAPALRVRTNVKAGNEIIREYCHPWF